jgi:mono/diheme cytochrome c family protein
MRKTNQRRIIVLGILVVLAAGAWGGFTYVRAPRLTPALRGSRLAEELGCFGCHGPGGTGGIPNPRSEAEQVPAWDGGTAMMYVENEGEIREWILYGRPKRLAKERRHETPRDSLDHGNENQLDARRKRLPLDMPRFEGVVSEKELDDLVAFYKAVAAFDTPPAQAREGYRTASRLGCFGCHGPGGRVGSRNPRSFKGYIPPWRGSDFADLVKSEDELREWILTGKIDRFESNPVARFFTRRQIIHMPAYRDVLDDGQLDDLVAYIQWLNRKPAAPSRRENRQ